MSTLPPADFPVPSFTLNDALLFVSTVALGSFTAAAERHGITPSGVSRAISRLERTIGVRLLVRTTRRLRLTEEGELFYESCREAIGLMTHAGELVSESSTSLKGLLRVGLLSILGTHYIVPMLPNLLTLHPQLSIQLVRVVSVEDFYARQVDCALLPGNLMESTLAGRELRPGRMVVVATPEYIARHGAPREPSDLHAHSCITLVQQDGQELPYLFAAPDDNPDNPVSVRVHGRIRTDDMEQVMAAALSGLGIAQVPHLPLQHAIAANRLVVLMPEHEPAGVALWIVYPARRTLPKRVRAFVDFMVSPPLETRLGGTAPARLLT
jgi:LysR family transcriptional regulator for bpeEF and oprC